MNVEKSSPKAIASSFKAGFTAQKTAIKATKLSANKVAGSQNAKGSEDSNNQNNAEGDTKVAKAANADAQVFGHIQPGHGKNAEKVVKSSRSKELLAARFNRNENGLRPGEAANNINNFRQSINDQAAWQAMVKGSQETAKALADGIAKMFAGAGDVAVGLGKLAKAAKNGGADQSSGGQQQSGGGAQQSAQDMQDMVAQDDLAGGGAEGAV